MGWINQCSKGSAAGRLSCGLGLGVLSGCDVQGAVVLMLMLLMNFRELRVTIGISSYILRRPVVGMMGLWSSHVDGRNGRFEIDLGIVWVKGSVRPSDFVFRVFHVEDVNRLWSWWRGRRWGWDLLGWKGHIRVLHDDFDNWLSFGDHKHLGSGRKELKNCQ